MSDTKENEKITGNSEDQFEELYHRYSARVLTLCFRQIGDYQEAQDCCQEVFEKVHRYLHTFQGRSQFSTWIYSIALNTARNRKAWLRVRRFFSLRSIHAQNSDGFSLEDVLINPGDGPEMILEQKEMQQIFEKCMKELDGDYRVVLYLRDYERMSYAQISETTGFSLSKVKTDVHRGRLKLAEAMSRLGVIQ